MSASRRGGGALADAADAGGRGVFWTVLLVALLVGGGSLAALGGIGLAVNLLLLGGSGGDATAGSAVSCGLRDPGPDETHEMVSATGETFVLDDVRLGNARTMIGALRGIVTSPAAEIVLVITAMPETAFRNLANPTNVPDSANFPHDGTGSDHDSIGILQQRPSMGWGDVESLMDPAGATAAFLGGPAGPNGGSPAGLLDIDGWERMAPAAAAQAVQVSAFPERYEAWVEAAAKLLSYLEECGDAVHPMGAPMPVSDGVGPRECPVYGPNGECAASTWHPAIDFDMPCGTPVVAARPGTVTQVSDAWVGITTPDGTVVSYLHMFESDVLVRTGDTVVPGQPIGVVGNSGQSSGCHLDFRVNTTASTDPAVLALPHIGVGYVPPGYVDPEAYMRLYGIELLA